MSVLSVAAYKNSKIKHVNQLIKCGNVEQLLRRSSSTIMSETATINSKEKTSSSKETEQNLTVSKNTINH